MINRSRIEVAVHAEPERPVVRIGRRYRSEVRRYCEGDEECPGTHRQTVERGRALQLGVHHVQAHVEVLGDIPLRTRTEPPGVPVATTAGDHEAGGARESAPLAEARTAAVFHFRVTAVE